MIYCLLDKSRFVGQKNYPPKGYFLSAGFLVLINFLIRLQLSARGVFVNEAAAQPP